MTDIVLLIEPRHEISKIVVCATSKGSDTHTRSLIRDDYSMNTKLFTKHNLEPLSLKGGCIGSSESTLDKVPHRWKSHVTAQNWQFEMFKRGEDNENDTLLV